LPAADVFVLDPIGVSHRGILSASDQAHRSRARAGRDADLEPVALSGNANGSKGSFGKQRDIGKIGKTGCSLQIVCWRDCSIGAGSGGARSGDMWQGERMIGIRERGSARGRCGVGEATG
jgi:hypothetical protein